MYGLDLHIWLDVSWKSRSEQTKQKNNTLLKPFVSTDGRMDENISRLVDTLRLTYGAGVVLKLGGVARLEINYCVPIRTQPGDR